MVGIHRLAPAGTAEFEGTLQTQGWWAPLIKFTISFYFIFKIFSSKSFTANQKKKKKKKSYTYTHTHTHTQ